jgi:protein phosphatase
MTGAGRTDTGPVRTANEDHWHIDAGRGLFIVADGMGGHQAGEVAAHLAVAEVVADLVASAGDGFAWPLGRDTAVARREPHRLRCAAPTTRSTPRGRRSGTVGMGTTLTVLLVEGRRHHRQRRRQPAYLCAVRIDF